MYQEVIKLIRENPSLEVVPFVKAKITKDNNGYWRARFGEAKVTEIVTHKWYDGYRTLFRDEPATYDLFFKYLLDKQSHKFRSIDEIYTYIDFLDWKKCIVVYIEKQ